MKLDKAIKAMDRRYDCADRYGKSLWKTIRKALEELPKTPTNKQSDVIPLWRVRDVLQGHFDYKTVNIVMDDME